MEMPELKYLALACADLKATGPTNHIQLIASMRQMLHLVPEGH